MGVVRRVSPASLAEEIPGSLPGTAFLREIPRIPFRACVVFWCSGILGRHPEKRGFGAPAPYVSGTWHVAVLIFGAKTRLPSAGPSAGLLVQTNPISGRVSSVKSQVLSRRS